jgi:metal-sulfur cluster biosynthetic enzyme
VFDPEVGINVVDLGLVYGVDVEDGRVHVRLTMTTPACPMSEQIVRDAEQSIREIEGVTEGNVELVWDPPWTNERMSPLAREALGWGR